MSAKLRVNCRNFLVRFRGRSVTASASTAYSGQRIIDGNSSRDSIINAEIVHGGDEQEFWTKQRDFYRAEKVPMPMWDRFAHTIITFSRAAPRIPQEAAFRLMAVYLKLLMITKIVETTSLMLPLWVSHNVQGLIGSELEKKEGESLKPKPNDNSESSPTSQK